MSMIKIENLTFSYPTSYDTIFENVNFQIDTNWKLGFVGRNGRGKTTFFHLLLGKYEYSGKIISSVKFDYFPYVVKDKTRWTEEILQEICPMAEQWELMRELSYLEVDMDVLWRPFETLSNGEQTKVLLAALFLNEEHFLLIDEPTNHLDMRARKIVASYLKKKKSFILISHDRHFLDECVDHILSLNRANIDVHNGTFSSWMETFNRQQLSEIEQNKRLKKDIHRLQQSSRQSAAWSDKVEASKIGAADKGFVGHKAAKMMKRSKAIEARQQQAIEEKSKLLKNVETAENLKLSPLSYHADTFISLSNVSVYYGKDAVCPPVSFTIQRGDKIALDGKNGSGKSSLLKLLIGKKQKKRKELKNEIKEIEIKKEIGTKTETDKKEEAPQKIEMDYTGTLTIGSGLIISYVPQDTSHLHGTLSDFARENAIDETLFKTILRKMDFDRIQFEKKIENFSGGQKKKVLIAKSLCEKAHLYIWDEPLNFIDIYSRMQIEQLIRDFSPTMIFVEHDRAFRENIATKLITL